MGSWKRTITSPFRKACTILSPQHSSGGGGSGSGRSDDHGSGSEGGRKTPRARHQLKRSGAAAAAVARASDVVESPSTAQLYGDVMACAYEDVQVMWSMLDNKQARVLDAAAS